MSERRILFSGEMVRALLEGCKTQTRRVVKPQPSKPPILPDKGMEDAAFYPACPHGQPGDRLWVKEGFWTNGSKPSESDFVVYHLEHETKQNEVSRNRQGEMRTGAFFGEFKRFPSIFMPRWASRITLEITGVKVERLQDISEEDAKAEGCDGRSFHGHGHPCAKQFRSLWDSINGDGAWDTNPWVWAIAFKQI